MDDNRRAIDRLPSPSRPSCHSIHVENAKSNEATKGAAQRACDEEIRDTNAQFFPRVPVAQEKGHRREQAAFKEAKEDACRDKASEVLHKARAETCYTPAERDDGDDAVELQTFDE
jgi:hypothetical protein